MTNKTDRQARSQRLRDLTAAAVKGDVATMRALLDDDDTLVTSDIPVLRACEAGQLDALTQLLSRGASAEAVPGNDGDQSRRPLGKALQSDKRGRWSPGRRACAEALVDAGATTGFLPSWNSASALVIAAAEANREAIAWIRELDSGPLEIFEAAALAEDTQVAEQLAGDRKLARAKSAGGGTALHNAAYSALGRDDSGASERLRSIAEMLVDAGAPIDEPVEDSGAGGEYGYDPIYLATWSGNDTVALVLADRGLDHDRLLRQSCDHQCMALLDWLAPRAGTLDLDQIREPKRGNTLLGEMIRWGRLKSATWLLRHGANPNIGDDAAWTPLHYAARRGTGETLLDALVAAGADIALLTNDGKSALDIARDRNKTKVVAYLEGLSAT